jgi:hypothetical protein
MAELRISAGTFKIAAGIYLIVVAMLSATIGGYMAGGLRSASSIIDDSIRVEWA